MWKIQSCKVWEFCISNSVSDKVCNDFISHLSLHYFVTKLHNFTKFMMLFPTVLMKFLTLKFKHLSKRGKVHCSIVFLSII